MNDNTIYKYTGTTKFNLTNGKTLRTGVLGTVNVECRTNGSIKQWYFCHDDYNWLIHFMDYERPIYKTKEIDINSSIKEGTYVIVKSTGHLGKVVGINEKSMLCISSNNKHNYYEPIELLIYFNPTIWEEIRYFFINR